MMTSKWTRRQFLTASAASGAGLLFGTRWAGLSVGRLQQSAGEAALGMSAAAETLIVALSSDQSARALFAFDDEERLNWHWTPGFARKGVTLAEMDEARRSLALDLLRASTSSYGSEKAFNITALQAELGRDPDRFFVSIFGSPSTNGDWGWRFEGHHLSMHFTSIAGQLRLTPMFLGARPTEVTQGSRAGLRAMGNEEAFARELVLSLTDTLRAQAIFSPTTPGDVVTGNARFVEPLAPVGILTGEFDDSQMTLLNGIIGEYLGVMPDAAAQEQWDRIIGAGLENIRFGWAGSLEPRQPHYYRLQGPTFLLDFDNTRHSGTHIHSVWRDFDGDFGYNLLTR